MQNPNPNWINLSVCCEKQLADDISDWLFDQGALSVSFGDPYDNTPDEQAIFEPDPTQTPIWQTTRVIGLFEAEQLADIQLLFNQQFQGLTLIAETLPDQIWEKAWLEHYQPVTFGSPANPLWVGPEQMTPPPNSTAVFLNPGLAFGTGTHPTTALCLSWLANHPPKDLNVIDYGSGSGILAITALKLGAKQVIAVDHCEQALTSTLENGNRNGIPQDTLFVYSPNTLPPQAKASCDLLLANILIDPLVQLAPTFAEFVKPSGIIVLSGLLTSQLPQLKLAYAPWFNFEFTPEIRDDWICIAAKRVNTPL
jgi:ribosomal protein L11 methyltransferase